MLQRAASNAYSWWWASHIRTKQSKWMEQNLLDIEEKVQNVLKMLEEDGDSFARRAEMYYKKRPELINFVEETYRAYRALAERYDHISTELQNANNTIASVFPEQVQFSMDEEDEEAMPRFPKKPPEMNKPNIPKVPNTPVDLKTVITTATKKLKSKKSAKLTTTVVKSGLSKEEALHEIDKLQKQILSLQTEKEFLKSSYESQLARYWEIENQIKEMQDTVFNLQDEYGEGMVIEDDDARNLMAKAALKSCQESLAQLQEKQERSAEEARIESTRIREVRERLDSLKGELHRDRSNEDKEKSLAETEPVIPHQLNQQQVNSVVADQELKQQIKEQLESSSSSSSTCLTMTEMAEKIDELVNKVISLETALSSQTALVNQLRSETDQLQTQIQSLEDDKASLVDGKNNVEQKLRDMEEKLGGIQNLNQKVENEKTNFQSQIIEVHCNLDHLSGKLPSIQQDEDLEPKSPMTTVQLEHADEESKDHEGSNDTKQIGLDETWQVTDMNSSMLQSSKEDESQSLSVKNEDNTDISSRSLVVEVSDTLNNSPSSKADYETSNTDVAAKSEEVIVQTMSVNIKENPQKNDDKDSAVNQIEVVEIKAHSQHLEDEVVQIQDNSQSSKGSYEKSDASNTDKSCEGEVLSLSVNTEGIPEKNDDNGSGGNPREVVNNVDEPNWEKLFLSGIEGREKLLLTEYTSTLRNFKDAKKKLHEMDEKNRDHHIQTSKQLNELKTTNALKDQEIRSLRHKLNLMQKCFYESKESVDLSTQSMDLSVSNQQKTPSSMDEKVEPEITIDDSARSKTLGRQISEDESGFDISKLLVHVQQPATTSEIEERLRMKIDELLEENLDFWLKFSTSFHQIQKFESGIQDLKLEVTKLQEKGKKIEESGNGNRMYLKSEARPLYKHLREIQSELRVWSDKSAALKDELKNRFSSLCNIQEEITAGLKASAEEDDFSFTSYQAAKFQGEVLNMKQENNKVGDELQAGLDHIASLQIEVETSLTKLNEEFSLAGSKKQETPQLTHSESRNRVPLRSFIFGVKQKKQKQSIFSGMAPVMQKKYHALRTGTPL